MASRYTVYGFLDNPVEILGVPLDRALAFIIPMAVGTAVGYMGTGIAVGFVVAFLYAQLARSYTFSFMAKLLRWGIPVKGAMPPPRKINEYRW